MVNLYFNYRQEAIFMKEPLQIKKRGEDGSKIITVRIKEETLAALDKIAAESNYSRNELINVILKYALIT